MRALILVGGTGTRLRPLTNEIPKPLVPFCGRPMVEWQIEALCKVGVREIVLAIGYKEQLMHDFVEQMEKKYPVHIHCSVETSPLNTAGPLKLAEKFLRGAERKQSQKSREDLFFVLNADIICEYPFEELVNYHLSHPGLISLLVKKVEDWGRFGIVVHDEASGKVSRFVEKPKDFVGDFINAGIYVFEPEVLDLIELKPTSLEREIFPQIAERGLLYCSKLEGFWKDIGLPKDYVVGAEILLKYLHAKGTKELGDFEFKVDQSPFVGVNLVHRSAQVDPTATVGPFCVLGQQVKISQDSKVSKSILLDGSFVGTNCILDESIIAEEVQLSGKCSLVDDCVIAKGTVVPESADLKKEKIGIQETK